jgi:Ca2+-binding RTX toxin-like protein
LGAGTLVRLDRGDNGAGVDQAVPFAPGMVTQVIFRGLEGEDYFRNDTAIPSIAYGGKGDDDLHGGSGIDKLFGEDGNDCLCGRDGDDWMYGGNGSDLLHGWGGDDHLFGDAGNDVLIGGDGNDWLDGGLGADLLEGLAGADHLDGGNDFDVDQLFGGGGGNVLVAHPGDLLNWVADGPFVPPC